MGNFPLDQELTKDDGQLNTHRGNTVNDNTSQFTYASNRIDNSDGGSKRIRKKV